MSKLVTTLFISLSLLFPLWTSAQTIAPVLQVAVSPTTPGPGQEVTLSLSSSAADLNRSTISWTQSGRVVSSGRGVKTFRFSAGPLGSATTITALVRTIDGKQLRGETVIRPAEVDFLWEADTYTPPFYRGKALASPGSTVRVTAVPHFVLGNGTRLASSELVFTWSKDRTVLGNLSGYGRDVVELTMPSGFRPVDVMVEVSSLQNSFSVKKEMRLVPHDSRVLLYERHPLLGVLYNKALPGVIDLETEETTLRAEPLYFSLNDVRLGKISFVWSLNGRMVPGGERSGEITLRQEGSQQSASVAQISLVVENAARALQATTAEFLVNFGSEEKI
ncbi:MAG: hypothetical protein HY455_00450 [Parcubacteria group bacterium]|nr:hypothetical protein [Parcubacteria group bacterium]